jgi:hypothetical protein
MPHPVDFYLGCSSRRLSQLNPASSPFETESETDFESDFDDENWSVRPCYYQLAKSISAPSIRSSMSCLSVGDSISSVNRRKTMSHRSDNDCETGEILIGYVHHHEDRAFNNKPPAEFAHHPPVTISLPSPVEERNPAFGLVNNSKPLVLHVPATPPPGSHNHKIPMSPPVSPSPAIKSKFIEDLNTSLPGSYDTKRDSAEYNMLPLSTSSSEFFFNRSMQKSHCDTEPTVPLKYSDTGSCSAMPRSRASRTSVHNLQRSAGSSFMSTSNYCTSYSSSTLATTTQSTNSNFASELDFFSSYVPIAQAPRDNSLIEINLDPVSPLILAATVADSSESLAGLEQQAIAELHLENHDYVVDRFHQRPLLDDPEKPFIPSSPVFPDIDHLFHESYPELDPHSEEYQYHKERLLRNRFKLRRLSQTLNSREELRRQRISLAKLHGFDQPRTKVKLF